MFKKKIPECKNPNKFKNFTDWFDKDWVYKQIRKFKNDKRELKNYLKENKNDKRTEKYKNLEKRLENKKKSLKLYKKVKKNLDFYISLNNELLKEKSSEEVEEVEEV